MKRTVYECDVCGREVAPDVAYTVFIYPPMPLPPRESEVCRDCLAEVLKVSRAREEKR